MKSKSPLGAGTLEDGNGLVGAKGLEPLTFSV